MFRDDKHTSVNNFADEGEVLIRSLFAIRVSEVGGKVGNFGFANRRRVPIRVTGRVQAKNKVIFRPED